jgi:hypothetical protein
VSVPYAQRGRPVYPNDQNAHRCPLRDQTGAEGVQHFDAVLASLPPELRAAFEAERARHEAELTRWVADNGYHT